MLANLDTLHDQSRVWIYPADKALDTTQQEELSIYLTKFLTDWTAHNEALKSFGQLFHNQFLTLFVDETQSSASGCSIDSSVHFVKQMGNLYQVDFLNRMLFSYQDEKGQVHTLTAPDFKAAYQSARINDDTLVFDHLVNTKKDFLSGWLKPLKDSWHKRFV